MGRLRCDIPIRPGGVVRRKPAIEPTERPAAVWGLD